MHLLETMTILAEEEGKEEVAMFGELGKGREGKEGGGYEDFSLEEKKKKKV
jgi:hypothetical protein